MLLKYVTLISGFNFLILSFILIFKKSVIKRQNLILGNIFLIMTLFCFIMSFYQHACITKSDFLLSIYVPLDFLLAMLMAPGIYFYVQVILNKPFSFYSVKTWLHFIPALPALIFIIYFMALPTPIRVQKLLENFNDLMWQGDALNIIFYIQMTAYLFVCYAMVTKQIQVSRWVVTNSIRINIHWLKYFFLVDIIMMLATAPITFLVNNDRTNSLIGQIVMDVQFIYIFIYSIWQRGVFIEDRVIQPEPQTIKKPSLILADKMATGYYNTLIAFMKTEKAYLNINCNIQEVSDKTKIPLHHLSNILNQHIKKKFFDFINEYRIEEAKKMLMDVNYSGLTIEAISYECGFGSKTTFNKAFKKFTSKTPSEYRAEQVG